MTRRPGATNRADMDQGVPYAQLHAHGSAGYLAKHYLTVDEICWVLVEEFQLPRPEAFAMASEAVAEVLTADPSRAVTSPNHLHATAPRPRHTSPAGRTGPTAISQLGPRTTPHLGRH